MYVRRQPHLLRVPHAGPCHVGEAAGRGRRRAAKPEPGVLMRDSNPRAACTAPAARRATHSLAAQGVAFLPRVVYNQRSEQYVMWYENWNFTAEFKRCCIDDVTLDCCKGTPIEHEDPRATCFSVGPTESLCPSLGLGSR